MELLFLGTGSAFSVGNGNYNSNMLLLDPDSSHKLLIDCGSDARHSLYQQGFSFQDIDDIYISHLHADHMGGLEWLALARKFGNLPKPRLYGNDHLLQALWQHSLQGGLSTLKETAAQLGDFFEVAAIADSQSFAWNKINFKLVQMEHYHSNHELMPSYGLFFTHQNNRVFITTDTQFTPSRLKNFYEQATLIFHDCETSTQASGVHARFDQLITLPEEIKNKMWLYHYNSEILPDAKAAGFRGFIQPGQRFKL